MYKAIIFDVDGTILDTESTILKSFQKTLLDHTGVEYDLNDLTFCLGIPGKESLRKLNIKLIDEVHKSWCENVLLFSNEVKVFEGLLNVLEKIKPEEAIYIGDSVYDMQCAKSAGVHFGLALWGAKTSEIFNEADYIFEKPEDILLLIEK